MNSNILFTIFGYAAAICMVFGYLPQAIHTIRTRETDGIALPTFMLMALGSIFFIVQGSIPQEPGGGINLPLIITNSITGACSIIVFGIKIYNDTHKKRNRQKK